MVERQTDELRGKLNGKKKKEKNKKVEMESFAR